jgi:hypothetical protein
MKTLITGGCSFSECISPWIKTWPIHLAEFLPEYKHISKAMGSQGNGLISRSIIYQVSELLKTTASDDILVGIMWSGPDRHDFYLTHPRVNDVGDGWMENPINFIPNNQKNWVIMNWGWKFDYEKQYYSNYHDIIGSYIYTLEHILRTQWFLKLNNIKYFMSTYTGEVLPDIVKTNKDTQHLNDMINYDHFLPVIGEYEWCRDSSGLAFPVAGDNHPSIEQHKLFTDNVIIPFLQSKKYL